MAEGDVSTYFQFFDKLNADIAAREEQEEEVLAFGVDRHQIERDKKYREKMNNDLRARPRLRNRPRRAHIVQGHMENPGADKPAT